MSLFQFEGQHFLTLFDRNGDDYPLTTLGNNSCNSKYPTIMLDSGYITDKNILPLTG